jgi:hypothetical protein
MVPERSTGGLSDFPAELNPGFDEGAAIVCPVISANAPNKDKNSKLYLKFFLMTKIVLV